MNETEVKAADDPQWGEPGRREPRWPATVAVVVALLLYVNLAARFVVGPRFLLPVLEAALIIPLSFWRHRSNEEEAPGQRWMALALIAVVNLANISSLWLLIQHILHSKNINGSELLISAANIWITNVIVFGLWYWELDRGGPGKRCQRVHREPDFLFPQMANPKSAPDGWHPTFVDYTYVSFTNATAFSPTDTMPLTAWAKSLMSAQAFISLITVGLVAARAVNILNQ